MGRRKTETDSVRTRTQRHDVLNLGCPSLCDPGEDDMYLASVSSEVISRRAENPLRFMADSCLRFRLQLAAYRTKHHYSRPS